MTRAKRIQGNGNYEELLIPIPESRLLAARHEGYKYKNSELGLSDIVHNLIFVTLFTYCCHLLQTDPNSMFEDKELELNIRKQVS